MDLNQIEDLAKIKKARPVQAKPQQPIQQPIPTKRYDAQAELKNLNEGVNTQNLSRSKLPSAIREEFMRNPIDIKPVDTTPNFVAQNPDSIARSQQLMERLDTMNVKVNKTNKKSSSGFSMPSDLTSIVGLDNDGSDFMTEELTVERAPSNSDGIDYTTIRMIIEKAIDEKFNSLKSDLLVESQLHQTTPTVKLMNISDKMVFVDSDDNIYECQMKYVGKRKKRKQ